MALTAHPVDNPSLTSSASETLLTLEDIRRLKRDLDADEKLFAELPTRIALKKKKLEAALLFAPDGFDVNSCEDSGGDLFAASGVQLPENEADGNSSSRTTWIGEVEKYIAASKRGVAHQEVLQALKALGLTSSVGDKGFYNAIARLIRNRAIFKIHGLLYSRTLLEKMVAENAEFPKADQGNIRPGGTPELVVEVLREHPGGLEANEIRKLVGQRPDAPRSVAEHSHYIYNVLAGLVGRGEVVKEGGKYVHREMAL